MKKNRKLIEQAKNLSSSDLYNILDNSNIHLSNNYHIEFYHAIHLSNEYQKQIIDLFENNMKDFYQQSNDGYNPNEKQKELFSNQSRYLIILSEHDLIAFAHFRFDIDYGNRVLYLYELQVNMKYQGQGLGTTIIEQLKILCQKTQMIKIVLTVQKFNQKAIDFYIKKCQFHIDFTNPSDEDVDYLILSFTV
jgi:ribosomal protein S18 acetylase RimI-like enzyme